ncbi:uncharacterized protein LOC135137797 isoform X2 [Zophobas morio]|uniref:uncharacterized protein LOC135137797 isoform X2 n=1 Tax=Zophobas morio TaxID=2755281 RepID=UPI003083DE30
MNSRHFEKTERRQQKPTVEVVKIQPRDTLDVDFPSQVRHPQTNLFKSKSDWYINLLSDDDLITDCENEPKHLVASVSKPGNFPLPEDEEVQIRTTVRNIKPERPRTYAPTLTKKKEDILEFRGVVHLEIGREICVKVRPKETLRTYNGVLQLVDSKGMSKTIRKNVSLKRGTKQIGKKELEMMDCDRTIYRLEFATAKELKIFQENEKSYHTIPSTSAFKNIGPWSQLRKLLKKRSSRDLLESKGILKNEPIFGNTLENVCDVDEHVPEVVTKIIRLIEEPTNITSVGLYRTSANLAVIQNIRFEINSGRWDVLEKHKNDVDVLTGTLKLFFRELKQPLISYETYQQLKKSLMNPDNKEEIRYIIDSLPTLNRSTLLFIIKHLLKVCQHKQANKMDLHNISICWGPSLIGLPEEHCTDLVTQTTEFTKITEDLLTFYSDKNLDEPAKTPDFAYEVVRRLTQIVENNIEVEGIYRKSGSKAKIEQMMQMLEKQNLTELNNGKNDIHDLCCVLKKYLANLRRKIVPDEFFHQYCDLCDKVEDSILRDEVRRMVAELPGKDTVLLLFEHLQKVVANERKNKMSLSVLADIWMTTLIGSTNFQNYKKKMPKYSKLFLTLLNLNEKVLPDLVADPKVKYWSKYDNVPDDIHNDAETSNDRIFTKL